AGWRRRWSRMKSLTQRANASTRSGERTRIGKAVRKRSKNLGYWAGVGRRLDMGDASEGVGEQQCSPATRPAATPRRMPYETLHLTGSTVCERCLSAFPFAARKSHGLGSGQDRQGGGSEEGTRRAPGHLEVGGF